MTALTFARASARRLARDRTALFFLIVLPVVVIAVVGASVGGFDEFRIGVVARGRGPLSQELVTELAHTRGLRVSVYQSEGTLRSAVRRSEIVAGVLVPDDLDHALRGGRTATISVLTEEADQSGQAAVQSIAAIVTGHATPVQAARFAHAQNGTAFDIALARARELVVSSPRLDVHTAAIDAKSNYLPSGFSDSAPTMLVLFVFINGLAFGSTAIDNRRLGIYERAIAAPVRVGSIIAGEAGVAAAIAIAQSLLIVVVGSLAFGVSWGDPAAAALLVLTWCAVGAGAGLLSGTLFRTPQQATAIGPALGIALGMLGGCMWPLQIVGPVMRSVGHLTPHAWAVDAWTALLSRGAGTGDIVGRLGVLAGFAAVLLLVASARLRRVLRP